MSFKSQSVIDADHHKGIIALNSISGGSLVLTGKSLTNAQPLHVAVVDTAGTQITSVATALVNGQLTATSTSAALPTNSLTQGVTIEALSTNTVSVFVGNSSVTASSTTGGIELPAGAAVTILVNNTNLVYVITASSTGTITFVGS